jgi:uncharacterized Rmd1/YagE family protein
MNAVIWSKNRACQLDLLLRSIKKYWQRDDRNTFKIVYNYDTSDYKRGYDKLIERFDWPVYVNEVSFKADLRNRVLDDSDYIGFFCDDDVFTREWEWNKGILMDPKMACLSLRLGQNITSHYIKGASPPPEITNGAWEWAGKNIDWGYPMSAGSGHIFRTIDIAPIIKNGTYDTPTEFEDAMNAMKIKRPKMFCYNHSKVVNFAVNRVQTKRETLCGQITARELNDAYLKNKQIDLEQFHYYENETAHVILKEFEWSS